MSKQFIKEALEVTLSDLGAGIEQVNAYFHPNYIQHVDGKTLDYTGFVEHLHSLRDKVEKLELEFDTLFEEGDRVCSVHTVSVSKKDGSRAKVKVIATFLLSEGKIILCDELTHLISGSKQDSDLGSC